MNTHPSSEEFPQDSIVEDILDRLLERWSGLRLYLARRRAGGPADPTMDTLLSELLRVNLGSEVNIRGVMNHLVNSH